MMAQVKRWVELHFRKNASLVFGTFVLAALAACSGSHDAAGVSADSGSRAATNFGDELSLNGYSIHENDGHTQVELKWVALRKPSADYDVFVHVLDASGAVTFQLDHRLKNAAGLPSSSWTAGDSVRDVFFAAPPPNHASGTYTLRIGAYVAKPMRVLLITKAVLPQPKDGWNTHAVLIDRVDCK
jgi:hypothetical protein